ncbi:MAG: hypothetical protein WC683_04910 [bacterium]
MNSRLTTRQIETLQKMVDLGYASDVSGAIRYLIDRQADALGTTVPTHANAKGGETS